MKDRSQASISFEQASKTKRHKAQAINLPKQASKQTSSNSNNSNKMKKQRTTTFDKRDESTYVYTIIRHKTLEEQTIKETNAKRRKKARNECIYTWGTTITGHHSLLLACLLATSAGRHHLLACRCFRPLKDATAHTSTTSIMCVYSYSCCVPCILAARTRLLCFALPSKTSDAHHQRSCACLKRPHPHNPQARQGGSRHVHQEKETTPSNPNPPVQCRPQATLISNASLQRQQEAAEEAPAHAGLHVAPLPSAPHRGRLGLDPPP